MLTKKKIFFLVILCNGFEWSANLHSSFDSLEGFEWKERNDKGNFVSSALKPFIEMKTVEL